MSSLNNGVIETKSFANAFQLTLGSYDNSILDTTIVEPKEKVHAPLKASCSSRTDDDLDPIFFDQFSADIREDISILSQTSPKDEKIQKQDIGGILQLLDTLHDYMPDISLAFLQIMIPNTNGSFQSKSFSLAEKYSTPVEAHEPKRLLFYNSERERVVVLGSWKNIEEKDSDRSGYVWNIKVPFGQSIMVQNILFEKLESQYSSLGLKVEKTLEGKDCALIFRRKHFKHAIILRTDSSLG